jgi:hypothetical protein
MTACKEIYAFLSQVSARNVTASLSDADASLLAQLKLVQFYTPDQVQKAQADLAALEGDQAAYAQESGQRAGLSREADDESRKTHSILFHLEGKAKQEAELQQQAQVAASLHAVEADLAQKQQQIGQLLAQRALLDSLTNYGGQYVGLTGVGALALRNLGTALYRVSDTEFGTYWNQALKITQDLEDLSGRGAEYVGRITPSFAGADKAHLWSISLGLAKAQPDPAAGSATYVGIYNQVAGLSPNLENRLMASEVLFSLPRPMAEELPVLTPLLGDVRKLGVANDSALGIASILLLGRRADGTLATPSLQQYLGVTRSYESAALLAIMNVPIPEMTAKFQSLRAMFAGWGYQPSEDVELSSAYLAVSELPADGISTKLAIIAKGLQTYLEYPLVAASVLASLSTLEANETLGLLEQAYEVVGRRAMPLTQPELITLAVRMLHGIRSELVGPLDTTAAAVPAAPGVAGFYGPRFFFVPIIVVHHAYFSTFSGIGGAHPGHVHGFGGAGVGGVGVG